MLRFEFGCRNFIKIRISHLCSYYYVMKKFEKKSFSLEDYLIKLIYKVYLHRIIVESLIYMVQTLTLLLLNYILINDVTFRPTSCHAITELWHLPNLFHVF